MKKRNPRGRPKTSALDRAEQLRAAKRRQRLRQRKAGLATVQFEVPAEQAERLRAARNAAGFEAHLERFLDEAVVDLQAWPALRELAWNRSDRWIPAEEALSLYERNWRFVDPARLQPAEADLLKRLRERFGEHHA